MPKPTRLGVLTPSSNTALEPLTNAILADYADISVHYSRFRVTEISLADQASSQFDIGPVLQAARLLADANVAVIGWSGTSAGWLGLDRDRALCEAITAETGIPATTSVLAMHEILRLADLRNIALYTPYTADVQARIIENFAAQGIQCVAETHLGISKNFDFALVEPTEILASCHEMVANTKAQAVITLCTNLRAAQLASSFESHSGSWLIDSVSTVIWKMLAIAGRSSTALQPWGKLFRV